MYSYRKLEKVLNTHLKIVSNAVIVYDSQLLKLSECQSYRLDRYEVYSNNLLSNEALDLILMVIENNETDQPFWIKVIKNLEFNSEETPNRYLKSIDKAIWLIKGAKISESLELIQALFEYSSVFSISKDVVVVAYLEEEAINPLHVVDQLEMEVMQKIRIIEGPLVKTINELHYSYNNAIILDKIVAKNFRLVQFQHVLVEQLVGLANQSDLDSMYESYNKLYPTIGLTDELTETIISFFQHNLNTTDTAQSLYLHRNTLIYRLNKIQQITNLDIKTFEDACKMKILLILKKNH